MSSKFANPDVYVVNNDKGVYVHISFPVVYFDEAGNEYQTSDTVASYMVFMEPDNDDLFVGVEDGQQFDGEQGVYGNHLMFARLAEAV